MGKIATHRDLEVYQLAFAAAMRIFEVTKQFPKEETYSLVDQIRRSSVQYVLIWQKRGASVVIKQPL